MRDSTPELLDKKPCRPVTYDTDRGPHPSVNSPRMRIDDRLLDVLVIGAGWAGLTAAHALHQRGLIVALIEKSRGPGGRSSTRREAGSAFDHGAQYFTARSVEFQHQVESWTREGLVASWQPRVQVFGGHDRSSGPKVQRHVAVPGMNAVCRSLATGLEHRFLARAIRLTFDGRWSTFLETGQVLRSRALLLTTPPAQAAALLGADHPLAGALEAVDMHPCIAVMLAFERRLDPGFDAAFVNRGPLSWVARDSSKPGRAGENWVLHAAGRWSARWLERDVESQAEALCGALTELVGRRLPPIGLRDVHRWRYALAPEPLDQGFLGLPAQRLWLDGDWAAGSRIEGAWRSGRAAATSIAENLTACT